MTIKQGWTGRTYEDIEVGDVYPHRLGRTITDADNIWFTLVTCNPNPIHFDANYAAQTEWKRMLVDSTFTLALVTGLSVSDVSMNAVNLGWDEVRLPHPVFAGTRSMRAAKCWRSASRGRGRRWGSSRSTR